MKTLALDCEAPGEYSTRLVAGVELTEEFVGTVKRLQQAVIGITDHTVELSTRNSDMLFYEKDANDQLNTVHDTDFFAERTPVSTRGDRLHVDATEFWFTCYVKYEDDGTHETNHWPIEELA